jgi:hypothetical protein
MLTNLYAFRTIMAFFAVGFFLVTVGAFRVSADVATITINTSSGLSGDIGPYATVTITLITSTTANVEFDSLSNGGNLYLMGGTSAADLNVNATSFSVVGTVTEANTQTGFSPTWGSNDLFSTSSVDGFGTFNLNVNNSDGPGDSATKISFTLKDNSGSWSSAANVVILNGVGGYLAAAKIFPCLNNPPLHPCSSSSTIGTPGFAAGNVVTPTPEPASMLLFGSGLLAIGTMVRRRRVLA